LARKKDLIIRGGYNVYPREIELPAMTNGPPPREPLWATPSGPADP
jgi:hypothetical protein